MSESSTREYVLGTGADELARLALQHRLWSDAAHSAWKHAGIAPGRRVLDVGCGPGFGSFDLAQFVRDSGRVVGIDESETFIAYLRAQAAARGLPQLTAGVGDVQRLESAVRAAAPDVPAFDIAYARWVLCFVPDPQAVVSGVAALLAPGGRFVVHDYFNYEMMCLAPRSEAYARVVAATAKSWRARGGDPDICAYVPAMMEKAGLRVARLEVHQRVARGHESMFVWPDVWWRIYTPKLVEMGYLSRADGDQVIRDLDAAKGSTSSFAVLPPVFEIIGEKA
ncbi:MAG: class I SAM-dependent methyltransferase [Phycisphaerales bacterium]